MEQEKKPFYKRKKFLYGLAIFFVIGYIGSLFDKTPAPVTNTAPQPVQAVAETKTVVSDKVSVGEEGYINTPSPKAMIALTEAGYKELTKIYIANDTMGIGEFLTSGKGFAVPKGTKVLVTDSAVGARKVRILEGDNIGKAGWIAMEWVSKTKN